MTCILGLIEQYHSKNGYSEKVFKRLEKTGVVEGGPLGPFKSPSVRVIFPCEVSLLKDLTLDKKVFYFLFFFIQRLHLTYKISYAQKFRHYLQCLRYLQSLRQPKLLTKLSLLTILTELTHLQSYTNIAYSLKHNLQY